MSRTRVAQAKFKTPNSNMKFMEKTGRRSFVQRLLCLIGGAAGASALQAPISAASTEDEQVSETSAPPGSMRFLVRTRQRHRASQNGSHLVCRGELFEHPEGAAVGEFYSNCFCAESTFGTVNPFAATNVELHTISFKDGTLFGMGANHAHSGHEKNHAILGGTGRFAGVRGSYTISEHGPEHAPAHLTLTMIS
ncbi:MAG: hypothetical protein JWM99_1224 [Verrucomicrobiales bacterium]|nr:hypothetical protein [Verrucomicrobiales bacterium]